MYLREKGVDRHKVPQGKGVIVAMTLMKLAAARHAGGNALWRRGRTISKSSRRRSQPDYRDGDGEHVLPMATSQDHERAQAIKILPNTADGHSAPVVTDEVHCHDGTYHPATVKGMAA